MTTIPTPPVSFDYDTWIAGYPIFAGCTPTQGQAWFNRADLYFANDICNPAICVGLTRFAMYLYMLTSHIAWLSAPRDASGNPAATGQAPPAIVGRISSATEGSVSVTSEFGASGSPSEAWFLQTPYGAEFWQATAQFRTARYLANPTVVAGTIFPFVPGYGVGGFRYRR